MSKPSHERMMIKEKRMIYALCKSLSLQICSPLSPEWAGGHKRLILTEINEKEKKIKWCWCEISLILDLLDKKSFDFTQIGVSTAYIYR